MDASLVFFGFLISPLAIIPIACLAIWRDRHIVESSWVTYGPPSVQPFSQVQSPNRPLSRFCLALIVLQCFILTVVLFRPGYTIYFSENTMTAITLVITTLLLLSHTELKWQYERDSALWVFGRALPIYAGYASVFIWAILHATCSCRMANENRIGWTGIAQICFWTGYWFEWWTRIFADKLEGFGC